MEGHQGTCIKGTWTKPKGGKREGGRWRYVGRYGRGGVKMETTILEKQFLKSCLI